jgi:hypothetical protein
LESYGRGSVDSLPGEIAESVEDCGGSLAGLDAGADLHGVPPFKIWINAAKSDQSRIAAVD